MGRLADPRCVSAATDFNGIDLFTTCVGRGFTPRQAGREGPPYDCVLRLVVSPWPASQNDICRPSLTDHGRAGWVWMSSKPSAGSPRSRDV
jgi:hypothetical protein